jgi:catechol 2,3-dioxygenase-like lactoylglutathione lyase family enzyme
MISRIRGLLDVRLAGIALAVEDLEKSIAWWEEVLEFELVSRSRVEAVGADAAIVRGAGIYIELLEAPGRYRIDALFADPPNHLLPVGNKA